MAEAENPLEKCIRMFHNGSYTGYSEFPSNILDWKRMTSHCTIHGSIAAFAIGPEISL